MNRKPCVTIVGIVVISLSACAGPKAPPKGPVYYVSEGVTKVVYDRKDAQIACERTEDTGSHVKETFCYTEDEVKQRYEKIARENRRFDERCPEPSLCKR